MSFLQQFPASGKISCPECCIKHARSGEVSYYHQLLGAVIVHPEQPVVIPLAPEPITRQDGATKNDCDFCEAHAARAATTSLSSLLSAGKGKGMGTLGNTTRATLAYRRKG